MAVLPLMDIQNLVFLNCFGGLHTQGTRNQVYERISRDYNETVFKKARIPAPSNPIKMVAEPTISVVQNRTPDRAIRELDGIYMQKTTENKMMIEIMQIA